ncbi:Hypothetical protein NTJ_04673 [Nesidiocoris tenuis]|uniref:Uncharacterized protein n=1 Tax=Nesidiocoris tenuis TaxID=355587 RepID=A0ABN7AHX3_9HEMI|nr:Hypothetical protein NTJ_04673 [Nesidiocoris tenuis]
MPLETEELFLFDDVKSLDLAIVDLVDEVDAFYAEVEALEDNWREFLKDEDAENLQMQQFYWSALTHDTLDADRVPSPLLGSVFASLEEEASASDRLGGVPYKICFEPTEEAKIPAVQAGSSNHETASSSRLQDSIADRTILSASVPEDVFTLFANLEVEELFADNQNSPLGATAQNASPLNGNALQKVTPGDPVTVSEISLPPLSEASPNEALSASTSTFGSLTDLGIQELFSRNSSETEVEYSHQTENENPTQPVNSGEPVVAGTHSPEPLLVEGLLRVPEDGDLMLEESSNDFRVHEAFSPDTCETSSTDSHRITSENGCVTQPVNFEDPAEAPEIYSLETLFAEEIPQGSPGLGDSMPERSATPSHDFEILDLSSQNSFEIELADSPSITSQSDSAVQPIFSENPPVVEAELPEPFEGIAQETIDIPCTGLGDPMPEESLREPGFILELVDGTESADSLHATSKRGDAAQSEDSGNSQSGKPLLVENVPLGSQGLRDSMASLTSLSDFEIQIRSSRSNLTEQSGSYSFLSDYADQQMGLLSSMESETSLQEPVLTKSHEFSTVSALDTSPSTSRSSSQTLMVPSGNSELPVDFDVQQITLSESPIVMDTDELQGLYSFETVLRGASSFHNKSSSPDHVEDFHLPPRPVCQRTQELPDPSIRREDSSSPDSELESITSPTLSKPDHQNAYHQPIEPIDQDMAVAVIAMLSKQLGKMSSKLLTLKTLLAGRSQAYDHVMNSYESLRMAAQALDSRSLDFKIDKLRRVDPQANRKMQESFVNNLIIKGVPESADENLLKIIELLFIRVGCPLSCFSTIEANQNVYLVDVKRASVENDSIRPIIAVFTNSLVRNRLLESSKRIELFSDELCEGIRDRYPIKIEEQLTPLNLHILRECERFDFKDDMDVRVRDGVVCLERHFDEDVIELDSLAALEKLTSDQESNIPVSTSPGEYSRNYFSSVD